MVEWFGSVQSCHTGDLGVSVCLLRCFWLCLFSDQAVNEVVMFILVDVFNKKTKPERKK